MVSIQRSLNSSSTKEKGAIVPVKVKEIMDLIVATNIFVGNTGTFVGPKEARLLLSIMSLNM